jgi:hypothetical protein
MLVLGWFVGRLCQTPSGMTWRFTETPYNSTTSTITKKLPGNIRLAQELEAFAEEDR